ncbi:MAG: D-alanyl-D-alanine carboxypeptidase family protein [Myxococcales bacterium]|nr:D-alanyl-D-alanine carboxypeptidase family protein [Myxococcales bacterium]
MAARVLRWPATVARWNVVAAVAVVGSGCFIEPLAQETAGDSCDGHPHDAEGSERADVVAGRTEALSSISCAERVETGYIRGEPFPITVVTVDGKPVERETANAYYVMAQAAARDGVELRVVSGFRSMAEQEYLYHCYVTCSCNGCALAARPGYSNHQNGHALDLNTRAPGVLDWLNRRAHEFGFSRTVPSEPWHWEWWGGGPGGGPCRPSCRPRCEGSVIVGADCGRGDCAAFGSTCVDDDLGARCVFAYCPARGEARVCLDERRIGHCRNGAIEIGDCAAYGSRCVDDDLGARCVFAYCPPRGEARVCLDDHRIGHCRDGAIEIGDCGAFAAWCSTAGGGSARCVSVFCAGSPSERPVAHDVCLPDGRRAHCDATGALVDVAGCPEGTTCRAGRCELAGPPDRDGMDVVEPASAHRLELPTRPGVAIPGARAVARRPSVHVLAGQCAVHRASPGRGSGGVPLIVVLLAATLGARRSGRVLVR